MNDGPQDDTKRKASGDGSDVAQAAGAQDNTAPDKSGQDNTAQAGGAQDTDADSAFPPYVDPKGRKILPRHKRLALRAARQQGLKPADANEALHLVSARGINIFGNDESVIDMAKQAADPGGATPPARQGQGRKVQAATGRKDDGDNLPVLQHPDDDNALLEMSRNKAAPGSAAAIATTDRETEILRIQRDLVRRRRARIWALMLRLIVFVAAPTAAVAYYFIALATPMYETSSEFVIQSSSGSSGGTDILGSLLGGTGLASSQDSIVVQGYLTSREAFLRLEEDFDYSAHFKNPDIDPVQRLPDDATLDDAYDLYRNNVTIGYDPTEGVVRMAVIATTPEASQRFSEALFGYAEERVNELTEKAREDQLRESLRHMDEVRGTVQTAQQKVVDLQRLTDTISVEAELSSKYTLINQLELQSEQTRLELAEILENPRPNESRAEVLRNRISQLAKRIDELRADLTAPGEDNTSLASIASELKMAEAELATQQLMLQQALSGLETARLEASRQVRYIAAGVKPIAPVEATYPKKVESTLLAFLVFSGIYIMVSLTLSILREQVSL